MAEGVEELLLQFVTVGQVPVVRHADAKREVAKRALLEIIPLEQHSNDLLMDTLPVPANFLHTLGLDDEGGDMNHEAVGQSSLYKQTADMFVLNKARSRVVLINARFR